MQLQISNNFIPNITNIYISLPITYKINLVQYCKTQRHRISVPCNFMLFFCKKKQNRTLGIVRYTIFLIYDQVLLTDAYFTLETTRLGSIMFCNFQQPHLGLSLVKFLFDLFVTLPKCAQLSIVYLITILRILVELLESFMLYIYNIIYMHTTNTQSIESWHINMYFYKSYVLLLTISLLHNTPGTPVLS